MVEELREKVKELIQNTDDVETLDLIQRLLEKVG